jgi:2-methylcitrate dehydratase PrpD
MTDLTQILADHVASFRVDGVSETAAARLGLDLADTLAAATGGLKAAGVPETLETLAAEAGPGVSRVIGHPRRLPATFAAQANATAAHALDFDDTLDEGGGMHAGSAVHSAALAVADHLGGVSGADYVAATALGLDVAARLALAPTEDFGWHRTSAFGVFGVTVAAGRLLGLTRDQFANAIGIACSQASGNRQCIPDGALTKRLQSGFSARDGITAARLAKAGLTGPANALEGRGGFFNLYQRGAYRRETVLDGLGEWLASERISLKPYPCGRNLHAALDATLEARAELGLSPECGDIAGIVVILDAAAANRASRTWPRHQVEAQFNLPFAVALAATTGTTPLAAFDRPDEVVGAVGPAFDKVRLEGRDGAGQAVSVEIVLADGRRARVTANTPRGHPSRPLTAAEVLAKFEDCNAFSGGVFGYERARRIVQSALDVSKLSSTSALTELLAG